MKKILLYGAAAIAAIVILGGISIMFINKNESKTIAIPATLTTQNTKAQPAASNNTASTQAGQTKVQSSLAKGADISFVVSARNALLTRIGDKNFFSLSLHDVSPYTTMLTERPHREYQPVPLQNFIKLWAYGEDSLAKNPPNGVLLPIRINGQVNKTGKIYLIVLTAPQYNTKRNTLHFTVKLLKAPSYLLKQVQFNYVTLLIER